MTEKTLRLVDPWEDPVTLESDFGAGKRTVSVGISEESVIWVEYSEPDEPIHLWPEDALRLAKVLLEAALQADKELVAQGEPSGLVAHKAESS